MVIQTKELGFVEIREEEIICFSHAIYGFEGATRFSLLHDESKPNNPFMWLQCIDRREPCFAVIDPHAYFSDYHPVLSDEDMQAIQLTDEKFLRFLVIATVPKNVQDMSLNLKCPIAINSEKNIAMQVILDNAEYPMRYYMLRRVGE